MVIDPQFWSQRRVLVTGHTGFKGSWLSLWLAKLGADVSGYALAPSGSDHLFGLANVGTVLNRSYFAEINDAAALAAAFNQVQPEIVFHLAAQALVRPSYADPFETFATNVMGTARLLECVRGCPSVKVVVVVTSDKCYENHEWPYAYRESDSLGGHDPYSASKGAAELVVASWRRSFLAQQGVSLASARAGNVIGGGDFATDRILPDCIRALEQGRSIEVRSPASIRPWQYVLEPLAGYLLLAQQQYAQPQRFAQAWNFGPAMGDTLTVAELVNQVVAVWGPGAAWHAQPDVGAVHEAKLLRLDTTLAQTLLGWQPSYRAREAVRRTVAWYRACREELPYQLCLDEIDAYQQGMQP
jgi:CDP-glucose 4,6-dehydratase